MALTEAPRPGGSSDDRMQVAVGQQRFLDPRFDAFTEQRAVGQNQTGSATGLENLHQQHEKQVSCFACLKLGRIVGLDPISFPATRRRISHYYVYTFFRSTVAQRLGDRIVVLDVGGNVDAVQ